jgi:hypothetical protein
VRPAFSSLGWRLETFPQPLPRAELHALARRNHEVLTRTGIPASCAISATRAALVICLPSLVSPVPWPGARVGSVLILRCWAENQESYQPQQLTFRTSRSRASF